MNSPASTNQIDVHKAVESLTQPQLLEVLSQFKSLCQHNPDQARSVLSNNPQLAYAILHIEVLLRLVDANIVQSMLQQPRYMPVQQPMMPAQPPPPLQYMGDMGMPPGQYPQPMDPMTNKF
ncbi:hypothetical protein Pelo_16798 [Pelomyxa schiedti]|nr:hypothetical protein Pelo_16798 [Pelomyxa schiedti]